MKIVECVPNFSEGRRPEIIGAIRNAAEKVEGVTVLDCENDPNHNRMVLTFVGSPDSVVEAALAASAVAISLIDLRTHRGEHPRMGAVDVVPFVPLREVTMDECVALANRFAAEYSTRFGVPVFLYEFAAMRPERKDLAKVREGQFEGLRELIGKDPNRDPDYGPKVIHPTAGATAVGARPILIAYNVNLATTDLSAAKKIAHMVRGRDGGLPTVKALGFELKDRSIVQVSMNLTDYKTSSMSRAFEAVSKHASELGVPVLESEVVGLVPMEALTEAGISYLKIANFSENQIIENRLFNLGTVKSAEKGSEDRRETIESKKLVNMSLEEFSSAVASKEPTPGGGTVAAYSGVLAASLVAMVCRLTLGKKGYEGSSEAMDRILDEAEKSRTVLQDLAEEDSQAYSDVSNALALPRNTEEQKSDRRKTLDAALRRATEVPAKTLMESFKVFQLAKETARLGNKNARSDAETAIELSKAAARGAWSNVLVNLEGLSSAQEFAREMRARLQPVIDQLN